MKTRKERYHLLYYMLIWSLLKSTETLFFSVEMLSSLKNCFGKSSC